MRKISLVLIAIILVCFVSVSYSQNAKYTNLFDERKGAKVVDFSSNYEGSWDVRNILENATPDENQGFPVWCTAYQAPFPHYVTVELPNNEWVDIFVFNNKILDEESGWVGISAKDIEIYASKTSSKDGFEKVASFSLELNTNNQVVKFTPLEARWFKFVITSNFGHIDYTEFGQIGVYDDKIRTSSISEEIKSKGFIDLYGVYFDFGSAQIKDESKSVIEQIVSYMKSNDDIKLVIEGHTDNVGSDATNQSLSERRAESLKNELVKSGISADRLTTKGYGSKKPVGDNSTETGRAQNRRVTIRK